ncbi:alpha/beta fold hydrolase [Lysinibacillus sp. NPDC096418]|uniref:alpha/beta fold hydrolase n=1 Tax=Lysinibacillus sp. NPDC096418 TaxID=3364138 RepID=UPI0038046CC2
MRKISKMVIKVCLVLGALLVMVFGASWIYHLNAIKKEVLDTPPPGKMVEVNGHQMHVYQQGKGKQTVVFLSGNGTSAPMLDFKPLWSLLSSSNSIAVVEKAGYGWSEVADVSREIDVILEETRTALQLVEIRPPYVLAAHSMSGIEAIRWAQLYPEEVDSIIGLDPAIPSVYEIFPIPSSMELILPTIFARSGMIRWIPSLFNQSAAIASGNLLKKDQEVYRSILYRRTLTSNMAEEIEQIKENAKKVEREGIPKDTPMLFFISNGKEIPIENWGEMLEDYVSELKIGESIVVDAGHYVHAWQPETIAEKIELFLNKHSLRKTIDAE